MAEGLDDREGVEGSRQKVLASIHDVGDTRTTNGIGLSENDFAYALTVSDRGAVILEEQSPPVMDDREGVDTFGAKVHRTLQARDWKVGVSNQDLNDLHRGDGFVVESPRSLNKKVEFVINDTRPIDKGANGSGFSEKDIAYTLTRVDQQGVVVARFGDECPACRTGEVECEPYEDSSGVDVECSLCWDTGTVRPYGSQPVISFPSRFGSNAQATEEVAQSFAHSGGAPAVFSIREDAKANNFSATEITVSGALTAIRPGEQSHHAQAFIASPPAVFRKAKRAQTSEDYETRVDDGIANTLNSFDATDVRTTHAVVESVPLEDDDPLNPIGLDSNRYRCIGNGVVAPVAEFIGRRIVAVDAKYWKEANG